jgi:polysaccharide export outer membrane protein
MENDGKLTLLEALAMAGGSNPTASLRHARLIRKTATGYSDVPILLKKVLRGEAPAPQLQLEDVLYIPSNLLKSTLHNQVPAILSATSGAAIYHSM